ncbi:MAG: hypothetical protein K0S45_2448 [Nitrospira sp.]|nr:hypothetical protein [Nitrospira sp.]
MKKNNQSRNPTAGNPSSLTRTGHSPDQGDGEKRCGVPVSRGRSRPHTGSRVYLIFIQREVRKMNYLQGIKEKLLSIDPGVFEPDCYLEAWFDPAVCRYLLDNAMEILPTAIRWGVGRPCECQRSALEYASGHPRATPWFGFQLLKLRGDMWSWEVHSSALEEDGTIIDSGTEEPEYVRYFAVPWSWELYALPAQKELSTTSSHLASQRRDESPTPVRSSSRSQTVRGRLYRWSAELEPLTDCTSCLRWQRLALWNGSV